MAERSNAPVLKTDVPQGTGGSNPSLSAKNLGMLSQDFFLEGYPRGRRGRFAKPLGRVIGARVRIPLSPPNPMCYPELGRDFFLERCLSGRKEQFAKLSYPQRVPGVRIPVSPPHFICLYSFYFLLLLTKHFTHEYYKRFREVRNE